jgi:hypothetical protein
MKTQLDLLTKQNESLIAELNSAKEANLLASQQHSQVQEELRSALEEHKRKYENLTQSSGTKYGDSIGDSVTTL